jgi:hypothetical protein
MRATKWIFSWNYDNFEMGGCLFRLDNDVTMMTCKI